MNVDPVNELQCRTELLWSPLQKVDDSPPIETCKTDSRENGEWMNFTGT